MNPRKLDSKLCRWCQGEGCVFCPLVPYTKPKLRHIAPTDPRITWRNTTLWQARERLNKRAYYLKARPLYLKHLGNLRPPHAPVELEYRCQMWRHFRETNGRYVRPALVNLGHRPTEPMLIADGIKADELSLFFGIVAPGIWQVLSVMNPILHSGYALHLRRRAGAWSDKRDRVYKAVCQGVTLFSIENNLHIQGVFVQRLSKDSVKVSTLFRSKESDGRVILKSSERMNEAERLEALLLREQATAAYLSAGYAIEECL